ncbi:SDR family NAD(P)-dependent oxidoreductase [Pedobacter antarcticus]|uniref:SDR family NAD(P)-dependent oxidoreductase n=1 Tax=Pedobacter antarcticus TaxID=34086 RepID=UPI001C570CE6|nr:SDR family oxidoreductase [Pedobacter antarcticus]
MFKLTGKVALITGGGSGIGRSMSVIFAAQGAIVIILDIDDAGSLATIDLIHENGGIGHYKKCSVADQDQVNTVIKGIKRTFGKIDIVVNNAGISHVGNVEKTTSADFEKLISVNVKGAYHVINAAVPGMKKRGGVILNMTSVASMVGLPDRFAYSMTKGAVLGMTLSVARDYLKYKIRCNCISPARVHTPFVDGFIAKNYPGNEKQIFKKLSATQPIGRMAHPDEVAHLALYLCSDEAGFITGSDYPIDGGFTRLNN